MTEEPAVCSNAGPTATLDLWSEGARACTVCRDSLPLGPKPLFQAGPGARLLIVGQAPGRRAHDSGLTWNDPSGDRLRLWLGLDRSRFYDPAKVAIVPSGLCYPGKAPRGGDLPPRPECAALWHPPLARLLPRVELVILVGAYAQKLYLGKQPGPLADTVRQWRRWLPRYLPLPHPSPRNLNWFRRHPWFEAEVLPELRERVKALLGPA